MKRLLLVAFVLLAGCNYTCSTREARALNLPTGASEILYEGGTLGSYYTWEWKGRKYMTYYHGDSAQPHFAVDITDAK